jgi:hypothetical protein
MRRKSDIPKEKSDQYDETNRCTHGGRAGECHDPYTDSHTGYLRAVEKVEIEKVNESRKHERRKTRNSCFRDYSSGL